jgi:phosphoribosylglycinamide formyltransferase-1
MIVVLTYDAPHRKTQDLLMRLRAFGHDAHVLAVPWEARKNHAPVVSHRPGEPNWPAQPFSITPSEMCANLNFSYEVVQKDELKAKLDSLAPEMVLVGGAGILPADLVEAHTIVNAHPAWIPYGRGLDSLKWCIYRDLPIGVTTHVVDQHADAGFIIDQRYVQIYEGDTFHALAHRQYEIEMLMMVDAIAKLRGGAKPQQAPFNPDDEAFPVTRRMPAVKEMIMLRKFEERVRRGQ